MHSVWKATGFLEYFVGFPLYLGDLETRTADPGVWGREGGLLLRFMCKTLR